MKLETKFKKNKLSFLESLLLHSKLFVYRIELRFEDFALISDPNKYARVEYLRRKVYEKKL